MASKSINIAWSKRGKRNGLVGEREKKVARNIKILIPIYHVVPRELIKQLSPENYRYQVVISTPEFATLLRKIFIGSFFGVSVATPELLLYAGFWRSYAATLRQD